MQKKIALRFIIGLVVMAVLFIGYGWLKNWERDPGAAERIDSAGMVAAIEEDSDGSRAVLFQPNGEKIVDKQWKAPTQEATISWMPDGNRLVFTSDRGGKSQNLFFWMPLKDETVKFMEQSRSMTAPWYAPNDPSQPSGLILAGGNVMEFVPRGRQIKQVLPPLIKDAVGGGEEGGGRSSTMEAVYKNLGSSFKAAKYVADREAILTVMRREDGEVAVLNFMSAGVDGKPRMPVPLVAGARVEIDSDGVGNAIIVVQDFKFTDPDNIPEQFRKDGKIARPYKNAVILLSNAASQQPDIKYAMVVPEDQAEVFSFPSVSPDGSKAAIVVSRITGENKAEPLGLVVMPMKEGGGRELSQLVVGDVSSPSWSPDGKRLVFIKREPNGKGGLYRINADGSDATRIAEGEFSNPVFSPQMPKS